MTQIVPGPLQVTGVVVDHEMHSVVLGNMLRMYARELFDAVPSARIQSGSVSVKPRELARKALTMFESFSRIRTRLL